MSSKALDNSSARRGFLPSSQLLEAAERLLDGAINTGRLGVFLSDAVFLADRLAEAADDLSKQLGDLLETLEQLYAVALDRDWRDLPAEEESIARAVITAIVRLTKSTSP